MTWEKGREQIEQMLSVGYLERVPANEDEALYLVRKAEVHVESAEKLTESDPEVAFDAAYAAARKSLTALLIQQGLRPTRAGGHLAPLDAAKAQLNPAASATLRHFDAMRRARSGGDYEASAGEIFPEDVVGAIPRALAFIDLAEKMLPVLTVFVPRKN